MGQKVSPIAQRLSINKIPDSRWIVDKKHYADCLAEDYTIRKFIEKKLKKVAKEEVGSDYIINGIKDSLIRLNEQLSLFGDDE